MNKDEIEEFYKENKKIYDYYTNRKKRIEELIIPLEKWDRDECLSEMSYLRNELHKINDSSKIHGKNGLLFMLSFENANKTCDIKHLKRYIARTRFQFEEWNK